MKPNFVRTGIFTNQLRLTFDLRFTNFYISILQTRKAREQTLRQGKVF